ncbi:MAG: hypothetical protein Q8W44_05675 [Candidatus Palauibacterales bacterium]|nr:hypothetical protein [Candidatus Palauibacterales bacterium]
MTHLRRTLPVMLIVLFASAACGELPSTAPSAAETAAVDLKASASPNAATTERQTFTVPFPDPEIAPYVPLPTPCLELGEPLQMGGIWTGWAQITTTARGRRHLTEYIDYSQVTIVLDDMTWLPGPGAHEILIFNWPARTPLPPGGFTRKHEFNTIFRSQNGLPDLRVRHRVKVTVNGKLEFVHNEFVPFVAECLGDGR